MTSVAYLAAEIGPNARRLVERLANTDINIIRLDYGDEGEDPSIHITPEIHVQLCSDGSYGVHYVVLEPEFCMWSKDYRDDVALIIADIRDYLENPPHVS